AHHALAAWADREGLTAMARFHRERAAGDLSPGGQ
ncbi:MAG: hypothetical protein RLZZ127_3185, partial [Planctomycetota bacterium]